MNVKERIYSLLVSHAPLTALVGTRIRPLKDFFPTDLMTADEKSANLPALYYGLSAGQNLGGINESSTRGYTLQFDIQALSEDDIILVQTALVDLLDDYTEAYASGSIEGVFFSSTQDIEETEGQHAQELYTVYQTL